ncbi:MAG: TonB-dependent receptor [Bacteroidota bacterium]|nr:TonB-dependent receptor [Bacteroidota bacterium]
MQNQTFEKQNLLKYAWLCIAFVLLTSLSLFAQNLKVSGTVSDSKGEALPGVTVVTKGATGGTVTDVNGNYSITNVTANATLVFSFVGMKTQEVAVSGRVAINVTLLEDAIAIDEVVAVGYGTVKKRDVIGSVASVSGEDLKQVSSTSFTAAMQGRAAGVNIRETSGTPGAPISVQVRGVNSINTGTDPLWIIDGMPVYSGSGLGRTAGTVSQNPMSTINPNDIQSVEVLKDAAATAIYGSRGSNGVIIVTTKSGKKEKGKSNVMFDYSSGVSELTTSPESIGFANTTEWFEIMDVAKKNGGRGVFEPGDILTANFPTSISRADALNVNTNWFDYVLRKGSYKDANFSYTQGLEKGSIFASFGYRSDKAVNVGNDFDRLTGRINIDLEPVKNFKTGAKMNLMYTNNYRNKTDNANPGISTGNVGGFGSAIMGAVPWYPVYNENDPSGFWNPGAGNLAVISRRDLMLDNKKTYRALGTLYAEVDFPWVKGLSLRTEGSTDIIQDNSTNWISGKVINSGKTYVYEGAITRTSYNYNAYLKYNTTFNENHSINAVAGTESQITSQYTREMEGRDPVGYNQELGSTSPGIKDIMQGYLGGERFLRSYFGRANYKLMDKYMLGVSLRRDGSSAFSSDVRWGNFAALSAGWIISEEKFFEPLKGTVNLLKLRGSFGQTGNESIPGNRNINTLNNSSVNRYGTSEIMSAGTSISIGNRLITWETTDSYDMGIDFALFNNRISGSLAYYMQNVSDMLLQISTPPSAAIGSVYGNVGDMKNWGWEFNVSSVNIDRKDFKWNTSFNFSTNHNEILSLTPEMERQKGNTLFVGGSLGLYKMSEYAGIDPERGVHMIWEIDRAKYNETGAFVKTGRKIPFTDTNSTLHEIVHKGKSNIPTFYGGIDNTFSYKGFELGVFFTFSGGNYLYNSREKEWTAPSNGYWVKKRDLLTNSWTTPGQTDAKYPLLFMEGFAPATTAWDLNAIDPNTGLTGWWKNPDINNLVQPNAKETYDKNGARQLTKYLEKGDYLRLKSVTLGYNIPKRIAAKMYMENLKVYGSATNLFTLTEYTGFDPETGANESILPSVKTFSAGVTVTF